MVETEDERGRKVKRSRANKKGEKIQTESNATYQTVRSQTRTERKTEKKVMEGQENGVMKGQAKARLIKNEM